MNLSAYALLYGDKENFFRSKDSDNPSKDAQQLEDAICLCSYVAHEQKCIFSLKLFIQNKSTYCYYYLNFYPNREIKLSTYEENIGLNPLRDDGKKYTISINVFEIGMSKTLKEGLGLIGFYHDYMTRTFTWLREEEENER